jgi:hypothetical protein
LKNYYIKSKLLTSGKGKMKEEQKQKKQYTSPEMKTVELRRQVSLLTGSGSEPPPWAGQVG